jgi:hypothetical protein
MIRKSKALGLALVAVLAMSAVVASAASASKFESAKYPVNLTGSQSTTHKFTAGGTEVTCKSATFKGSASGASETQTIHPEYKECTAFGFLGATITTTGCDYKFHAGAETGTNKHAGTVDVVCEAGKAIKVSASTCALEIKGQNGLSAVSFLNETSGANAGKVTVGANVASIAYTTTQDGFLCPLAGTGNFNNGGYTGDTLVSGDNGAISVNG